MKKDDFDRFLKERYYKETSWYDSKANFNHKMYNIFQWTAIVLSALAPVLFALNQPWSWWLAIVVAIGVAISTSSLKAFKYQENWLNFRTTCETLRKEIYFYEANLRGYDTTEDKEALFVDRVESLISRENTLWITTQEKEENQKRG